jgi:hypothetical protein
VVVPMPNKYVGEYWFAAGSGSHHIADMAAQVNLVYFAFAKGTDSTSGTLHLQLTSETDTQLRADIATLHSKGIPVVLSIGGINDLGSSHGYNLKTTTQVNEAVASLKNLISSYSFDGIDWDLEDPFNFTVSAMVSVTNQLVDAFPGLIVTMASMYFDAQSASGMYRQVATALGSRLTCYNVQFYDHSGWTTTSWVTDVTSTVDKLVAAYGANRVGIGYMRPDDNGLNVPAATLKSLWTTLVAKYPGLRGGFRWTSLDDKNNAWEFASGVGSAILAGSTTVTPTPVSPSTTVTPTTTTTTTTTTTSIPSVDGNVRMDGTTANRLLNGVNIARGTDQLIAYTPAKYTVTPTNMYGTEATIRGGKVVAIIDRSVTGKTTGTPIPSDGVVLSGHGASKTWMNSYLKVGMTVHLPKSVPLPW